MQEYKIKEQDDVLASKKKNIIVSASAGSGKTHVLVKYITNLITSGNTDISRVFVMTFTKKAAKEMKTRLEKSLRAQPQTPKIIAQIDKLANSNIATIDSFCERIIKKYINFLEIPINFEICDENQSKMLKYKAFKNAMQQLQSFQPTSFANLVEKYGLNESVLFEFLKKIEAFCTTFDGGEQVIIDAIQNPQKVFLKACDAVCDDIDQKVLQIQKQIQALQVVQDLDVLKVMFTNTQSVLSQTTLKQKFIALDACVSPKIPAKNIIGEDFSNGIRQLKSKFDKLKTDLEKTNIKSANFEEISCNTETKSCIFLLFEIFEKQYSNLKENKGVLDFADLEKYASKVVESQNDEICDMFDYIFIDEYQDTNKIQEQLIKKITKKSHFFAVGDAKQGIYGFRNASVDIILDDIRSFSASKDADVLYLKNNFRSNKCVLDFINLVFKEVMTQKTCKIDYGGTSMLNSAVKYKPSNLPSVSVDIVDCALPDENADNNTPAEASEEDNIAQNKNKVDCTKVYSVKQCLVQVQEDNLEYETIFARINECLSGKIYDPETESFRDVEFKDIAILSRKREDYFLGLAEYLAKHKVPVFADSKQQLLQIPEIEVLVNLAVLSVCKFDEVALLSVTLSKIGGFTCDDLTKIRQSGQGDFCDVFFASENPKVKKLEEVIARFSNTAKAFGVFEAYLDVIDKFSIWMWFYQQKDSANLISALQKFCDVIKNFKEPHNVVALIDYFKQSMIEVENTAMANNQILLTTIHASKGLEYPIVFIVGGGESLSKSGRAIELDVDEYFGISTKDIEDGKKYRSIASFASKIKSRAKDYASELMIFYVATTRAKNNLYIIGSKEKQNLLDDKKDSYIDLILQGIGKNKVLKLQQTECLNFDDVRMTIVTSVKNEVCQNYKKPQLKTQKNVKINQNLLNYLDFFDKNEKSNSFPIKNSVTSLLKLKEEDTLQAQSSGSAKFSVDEGILYHEALKNMPYQNQMSLQDVEVFLAQNTRYKNLSYEVLYKNACILCPLCKNKQIFREQEFILKENLANVFKEYSGDVLIQGVVDLFMIDPNGKDNILIDFKWTSILDEQKLAKRYRTQLMLYKDAISKKFKKNIEKTYILSLKNAKLIEIV